MSGSQLSLWLAGLALEILLLVVVVRRGHARTFPIFATLLAFYVLRALLLVLVFGYVSPAVYLRMADALALADFVLQLAVAGEITFRFLRNSIPRPRATIAAGSIAAVIAVAAKASGVFSFGVERASAALAILMLFLMLWMLFNAFSGPARRLATGFAAFEFVSVVADSAARYAALHRNTGVWIAATWAKSGIWMAVVLYWVAMFGIRDLPMPRRRELKSLRPA